MRLKIRQRTNFRRRHRRRHFRRRRRRRRHLRRRRRHHIFLAEAVKDPETRMKLKVIKRRGQSIHEKL